MKRGKFITLEGGEGSGKSTQIKALVRFLCDKGLEVVTTREIGGSPSAEAIREFWLMKDEGYWDPLSELLLIMAARREHLVKTIWPALSHGTWVVSDRFVDSSRVYQGICQKLGIEVVDELYNRIAPDFEPDLTLLFDLPVEIGLARMTARGGLDDRFQQKGTEFHQELRSAYLGLAQKQSYRFRVVDASGEVGAVTSLMQQIVNDYFKL